MDRCVTIEGGKVVEMRRQPSLVVTDSDQSAPAPPGYGRKR